MAGSVWIVGFRILSALQSRPCPSLLDNILHYAGQFMPEDSMYRTPYGNILSEAPRGLLSYLHRDLYVENRPAIYDPKSNPVFLASSCAAFPSLKKPFAGLRLYSFSPGPFPSSFSSSGQSYVNIKHNSLSHVSPFLVVLTPTN